MKQAINVTYEANATDEDIKFAIGLYQFSKGDPFMFNLGIRYYLSEDKKTYEDFIALDTEKKIEKIEELKDEELYKASLLCSILGIAGITVSLQNSTKLLACCSLAPHTLESLAEQDLDFLFKQVGLNEEQYRVRHEKYAIEFLVRLYDKKYGNDPDYFDRIRGIRVITNSGSNTVSVIDEKSYSNKIFNITKITDPENIAINGNTNITYVTSPHNSTVYVIDGNVDSNKIEKVIQVGKYPQGIAINNDMEIIYVVNKISNFMNITTHLLSSAPQDILRYNRNEGTL